MAWYNPWGMQARARLTPEHCDGGTPVQDPITRAWACPQDGVLVTPAQANGPLSADNPRGAYRYQGQCYITRDENARRQGRGYIPPGMESPFDLGYQAPLGARQTADGSWLPGPSIGPRRRLRASPAGFSRARVPSYFGERDEPARRFTGITGSKRRRN